MKVFGAYRAGTGEIRLAESGAAAKSRRKEMSAEKRADIEACLNCTKKRCTGCVSTHENKFAKRRKEA